jgi:hypothetical protein
LKAEGGAFALPPLPESIWNGNEPSPEDKVEKSDPVERPSILLLGGAGVGLEGGIMDVGPVDLDDGASFMAELPLKTCWASGECGGDLMGLSDIGEGGTKGNDSRIESALVEAADKTDEFETLRFLSKPWACARACA